MNYPPCKSLGEEWIKDICKIGQGEATCKYLVVAPTGIQCAKMDPSLRMTIDQRADKMNAKGDCCSGVPMLTAG